MNDDNLNYNIGDTIYCLHYSFPNYHSRFNITEIITSQLKRYDPRDMLFIDNILYIDEYKNNPIKACKVLKSQLYKYRTEYYSSLIHKFYRTDNIYGTFFL